jgi:hypothetical protein
MSERLQGMLYDSEATLRLLDGVLEELQVTGPAEAPSEPRLRVLPGGAGADVLAAPRTSRGERRTADRLLEPSTLQQFHQVNEKLREVSEATAVANGDLRDGLDRSLALVERLDGPAVADAAELRARLREEILGMIGSLQIQEITCQQLRFASSVIAQIEGRIAEG